MCKFRFEGREFVVFAGNDKRCDVVQTVVKRGEKIDDDQLSDIVNRFLSSLAWMNRCHFYFTSGFECGAADDVDLVKRGPISLANRAYRNEISFYALPEMTTREQEIAISLFNEAACSHSPFYRFLCYWRIIDLKKGLKPHDWVNSVLNHPHVSSNRFIKEMVARFPNVGFHLKENFRNAIAHVNRPPILTSARRHDFWETSKACQAVEPIVRIFMEKELGLSKHTRIDILKTRVARSPMSPRTSRRTKAQTADSRNDL
jgi:hypothetical protein